MPRRTSPQNRRWWDIRSRTDKVSSRKGGKVRRGQQRGSPTSLRNLSLTAILSQTKLMKEVSDHPRTMTILQILVLTVTTASVGTLIAKFVPEAAINNASNGVYITGLVIILLIETIYQWGLRAAMLATEEGISAYIQIESPETDVARLTSELERQRESNEEKLKRTLEPVERVSLLAIGIVTHLIAVESSSGEQPPTWATTLADDWAITLLLGLAGLLWQLKNQSHISTLTSGSWVESLLRVVGNRLLIVVIPVEALGSVIILSVAYYPWGTLSVLPLSLGVAWYGKKLFGGPQMAASERPDQKNR